jgi:glycosyltransferase involved in cell wall biosynthesis
MKFSRPEVTVVLPTYNHGEYVDEAITSVLAQTFEDYELLILDDCSSDVTMELLKKFKDPRVRCIRHYANIGLVANWTYGIKLASGKYVAILSDDDKYKADFLLKRVLAFRDHKRLVAATGAFECCDSTGAFERFSKSPSETEKAYCGKGLVAFALGMTGEWFNGATLYDLDKVRSVWPYVVMAGTALDFSLHIRLSLIPGASVYFLPNADMMLRVHSCQESKRNSLHLAECGAKLAFQMWRFELRRQRRDIKALFRRRLAKDLNHYARMLWDRNRVDEARHMFLNELSVKPTSLMTWARLFRSYVTRPKHPLVDNV